jgi:hypothetical protein
MVIVYHKLNVLFPSHTQTRTQTYTTHQEKKTRNEHWGMYAIFYPLGDATSKQECWDRYTSEAITTDLTLHQAAADMGGTVTTLA